MLAAACADAADCDALAEADSARVAAASAEVAAVVARFTDSLDVQPAISDKANTTPANPISLEVFPSNPSILFLLQILRGHAATRPRTALQPKSSVAYQT
ncbi:MAG TPA: hypothetical protein VNU00_00750 [Candidatus Binataceae bacterium]|nr:hypothetical protein [Candidatus Binataceae bacterium]